MKALHILLVEDNEGDILLTTEAIEDTKMDIRLSIAKDGKEAIDFMSTHGEDQGSEKVNLVLLDINLPKKNGHEVLKYLKGDKNLDQIPVIMLTTSSSQRDIELCRKNLVTRYIVKPLVPEDLLAMVESL